MTWNLTDFPAASLAPYGIDALDPDEFVLNLLDLAPGAITTLVSEQSAALKNPPMSVGELVDTLLRQGLVRAVARLRELMGGANPMSATEATNAAAPTAAATHLTLPSPLLSSLSGPP